MTCHKVVKSLVGTEFANFGTSYWEKYSAWVDWLELKSLRNSNKRSERSRLPILSQWWPINRPLWALIGVMSVLKRTVLFQWADYPLMHSMHSGEAARSTTHLHSEWILSPRTYAVSVQCFAFPTVILRSESDTMSAAFGCYAWACPSTWLLPITNG
jgi:hypothetical protein